MFSKESFEQWHNTELLNRGDLEAVDKKYYKFINRNNVEMYVANLLDIQPDSDIAYLVSEEIMRQILTNNNFAIDRNYTYELYQKFAAQSEDAIYKHVVEHIDQNNINV
jgi:hypothetical protein